MNNLVLHLKMAIYRSPLSKLFSYPSVCWSPLNLIHNHLSPRPLRSLTLSASLSTSSHDSCSHTNTTQSRWKPMCLYHTQGKCTMVSTSFISFYFTLLCEVLINLCLHATCMIYFQTDDPVHLEKFNHDCSRELQLTNAELHKISSQNFDFFLVLDLEGRVEILEFPVLMISSKTSKVEDIFHRFLFST